MKKINLLLLISLSIFSCTTPQKESFRFSGTIQGNYSDYIYLNYKKTKDSVKVENQHFEFNGSVEKPTQGWLHLTPDANVVAIYIENSNIQISANYTKEIQNNKQLNILEIADIKGSYSARIQQEYKSFYQKNKNKENFKNLLFEKLKVYIQKNNTHPFSGTILGELALVEPVLTKRQLTQLYAKLDTTQQNKDDLKMFEMGIANLKNYAIGDSFIKFTLPNVQGEKVHMKSFLGKIVLVDFWASSCKPCREKHPKLVELKKRFDNHNFDIISISTDNNQTQWLKAIDKDKLTWTNLLDYKEGVTNELGIQAIPFNYLIDEKGDILGINVSLNEIERKLTRN